MPSDTIRDVLEGVLLLMGQVGSSYVNMQKLDPGAALWMRGHVNVFFPLLCHACVQEDTSWVAMKAFLGKRSVKEDILGYDAHRILTAPGELLTARTLAWCARLLACASGLNEAFTCWV